MLILASASPRRHELLLAAGLDHVVRPAEISEERRRGESPLDFVRRMAEEKAGAVPAGPAEIVLGADTIVVAGGEVFGKPVNDEDAARMLRKLSGRDHHVCTGICLLSGRRRIVDIASTKVSFAALTEDEIAEYTRSGEPRDKAGAYAIQGLAAKFIDSIEGSHPNVVGLPVSLVYRHLKELRSPER
ncbi:MAG TPA: Maf family protein [Bryobacteraceae bacterium]